jgi:hypothetical protein
LINAIHAKGVNMKFLYAFCLALSACLSFSASAADNITAVAAKINDPVTSGVRSTKYEEPLDVALKEAKLGEVTGGGNSVNKKGEIEWAGVDIEINDLQKGIPLIRQKLLELGAPKGSLLEYKAGGKKIVVPVQ